MTTRYMLVRYTQDGRPMAGFVPLRRYASWLRTYFATDGAAGLNARLLED